MGQLPLEQQFPFSRTEKATETTLQNLMRVLEARFSAIESVAFDFKADEADLLSNALGRINDILIPAFTEVKRLASLGAIFQATSASVLIVGTGSKTFVVDADLRETFCPAAYVSALAADGSAAMAGQVTAWDSTNGSLVVAVSDTFGTGTVTSWQISPATPPLLASAFIDGGFYDGQAASTVKFKRSVTHNSVPTSLADGEIALNTRDALLFWKDTSGNITSVPLFLNIAGGLVQLDGAGKVPSSLLPANILGALQYQGTWNAAANSPTLLSGTGTKGAFFKVSTGGTTALDGIGKWEPGDLVIFDGTAWDRVAGGPEGVSSTMALCQCELKMSGANLVLVPVGGGAITINGVVRAVPSAGVALAPTGLTAGTGYYIYARFGFGGGTNIDLVASATSHVADAYGHEVKSDDPTLTLVGWARPVGSPVAWVNSSTQRLVRSWKNSRQISLSTFLTSTTSFTASSPTDMPGMSLLEWFQWEWEVPLAFAGSTFYRAASPPTSTLHITVDGNSVYPAGSQPAGTNYYSSASPHGPLSGLGEGYHAAKLQVENAGFAVNYLGDTTKKHTHLSLRIN